jgi:hypothetical protein
VGTGGDSFELSELKVIENGEYSSVRLLQSEYVNAFKNAKYRLVQTSEGKTIELETLTSFGGGVDEDGNIIQSNSTNLFYSFDGSNPSNTNVPSDSLDDYDHRNFYCPYGSVYDGYHSFMGFGGNHKTSFDAQDHSGAGGSGYLPNVSKEIDKSGKIKPPRVGKGGNGGLIMEYDNEKKINIYVIGYKYIELYQNKIVFLVQEDNYTILFENRIYSIAELIFKIQSGLPQGSSVSLTSDNKLKIKILYPWTINLATSSFDLLSEFGFTVNDNKTWTTVQTEYEVLFSNTFYDVCLLDKFKTK